MNYDLHKLAIHNFVLVGYARPISQKELLNQHFIWLSVASNGVISKSNFT